MYGGACTSQKGGFICLESAFHVWFLCSLQLRQHSWCSACFHVRGRSAGTVGGDDSGDELANVGGSINNTSLSISLPSYRALSETDRWQRDQVASYTATIDSGTYSDTKTAEAGGSLLFSAIPVGHYVITAYAKTANGDIMANTDPDNPPTVDVVAGQTNSATVQLNRLYYKTVSFRDDDGGPVAGIPEQRVTVGYTATKPEDPASPVAGKFFSHWVKEGGDSSAYNFNDPVTENITLRPVFSDKCKVEFDLNYSGCTNPDPLYAMAGETVSPPSDPVRTGCTFAGWYTSEWLAGGSGTAWDSEKIDATYARVDGLEGNPGYFTEP